MIDLSEYKLPRNYQPCLEKVSESGRPDSSQRRPLEVPHGKTAEALSAFLPSLCPATTGEKGGPEAQWGWKPGNPGFQHQLCPLCPGPWASLEAVVSEVSLAWKRGCLHLPYRALDGIQGGNVKDPA